MSSVQIDDPENAGNSLYAALARTATRGVTLYFSRPVRLFRPSKVSGWQTLKGLATQHGEALTPRYVSTLVKEQGLMVIPKHFIPPMMVNIALGSVLWSTYSETSDFFGEHVSSPLGLAALSGGIAGGAQALVAAPAENVRFILEGGTPATGWSIAWKEVFRGTDNHIAKPKADQIHEAREVRQWMREVGEMAGRGWNGWGWGCAKDICGFAVFFSIFELTRRVASQAKVLASQRLLDENKDDRVRSRPILRRNIPRIVHAVTLVAGGACAGLAYELASRPWDIARKTVHIDRVTAPTEHHSIAVLLLRKLKDEGLSSYFVNPSHPTRDGTSSHTRRVLRTLARVGPWGVGFLVWEAFRPGASHIALSV